MLKELIKLLIGPVPVEQVGSLTVETKTDTPVIDEETKLKEEQSAKILDIILKDLEKYPPSEWVETIISYYRYDYNNPCLSYELISAYSSYSGIWYMYLKNPPYVLINEHQQQLYRTFNSKLKEHKQKIEDLKILDFLDDSKRILCKDNE